MSDQDQPGDVPPPTERLPETPAEPPTERLDEATVEPTTPSLPDPPPEATSDVPPIVLGPDPIAPIEPVEPTVAMAPTEPLPPVEPTTMMPVAGAAAVPPPLTPIAPVAYDDFPEEPVPWYKQPGPVAFMIVVVLLLLALLAWIFLAGGDDDEDASPETSRLTIETRDETGAVLDRGFLISLTGPVGSESSFTWLRPDDGQPGESTGAATGTDGRVDFEWQPDETVTDPAGWSASVSLVESIPLGWTPPGPLIDCALVRVGASDSAVSMSVEVVPGDTELQVAYTFPNYSFLPGDAVGCELTSIAPADVTSTSTATTVVDTTVVDTTVVDTTVAETTTTEAVTTTAPTTPPTTAPPTTIPVVTVPPQPEATLWDVIDNSPGLTELKALIEFAELEEVFQDPDATITLFAPSNQAIEEARNLVPPPDFDDPDAVRELLLAHVIETAALSADEILALDEVEVVEGGPQPVDADAGTVGGAELLQTDVRAANGFIHVIDMVLTIQP
jgi:uncharacterized surface protein with fasciclin (FAS1) repeats